jgi:hypothetical protein
MKSYHSSALPITAAATWSGFGANGVDGMAFPSHDLPRLTASVAQDGSLDTDLSRLFD